MMEVKLFYCFVMVLHLFTAAHFCDARISMEKVKALKHLNLLNKPPVKSIKSPDGDTIDCVHISHQLAFDHPLLKNHTIKMRPSYQPSWVKDDNINKVEFTQLWHSNGKCPKGTIPVVRTKLEDVLSTDSIKIYGKKKTFPVSHPSSINPELTNVSKGHEYATATTYKGQNYGAKAIYNIWNPKVQEHNEFSLSQVWISAGPDSNLNTIEAGWQVAPEYGDTNTRLFIYWTSDGYQKTGCYNLKCSGFVQTNNEIALGASISPTSRVDGTQYGYTILIWKDKKEGNWWMQLGDGPDAKVIGYWPSSLFSYLSESASAVAWGGEVINRRSDGYHTTTQMGSGHFPQEGFGKAAFIRNIQIVDASNTLMTPQDLNIYASQKGCYDIVNRVADSWGSYIFFGGPGRNKNCP